MIVFIYIYMMNGGLNGLLLQQGRRPSGGGGPSASRPLSIQLNPSSLAHLKMPKQKFESLSHDDQDVHITKLFKSFSTNSSNSNSAATIMTMERLLAVRTYLPSPLPCHSSVYVVNGLYGLWVES